MGTLAAPAAVEAAVPRDCSLDCFHCRDERGGGRGVVEVDLADDARLVLAEALVEIVFLLKQILREMSHADESGVSAQICELLDSLILG